MLREMGREGQKLISSLLYAPQLETGPQRRHVPWLGIELATFHFMGQCPTN